MIRSLLPAALFTCLATAAAAATLSGIALRDTYDVNGQHLVLNGIGLRTVTFLRIRIYVAGLYVAKPTHNAQEILDSPGPKVLVQRFVHAGTKEQVEKEFIKGEQENCVDGDCPLSDKPDFERLVAAAPAVEPGDTWTYIFADGGMQIYANGKLFGQTTNANLAYHMLAGFIGAHPPTPELREQLLGLPAG